jgi:hypothetical protein
MSDKKKVHSTGRSRDAQCVYDLQEPEPFLPNSLSKDKVQDEGI